MIKKFNSVLIILTGIVLLVPQCAFARSLVLAAGGKTDYAIVVARDAIEPERNAAKELQDYLKQVTGATFAIHTDAEAPTSEAEILIGQSEQVRKLVPKIDWDSLGQDGIVMKTVGKRLILAGGRPRGTLYAVYTFLEDMVGCRWWSSAESYIPVKPDLKIRDLNITYVPQFRYRAVSCRNEGSVGSPFAIRLKLNWMQPIPPEYGGAHVVQGICHTFYQLLPPDKYFAAHPEWYSQINGRRTAENGQLCLTNEEMRKELTHNALEWLRKDPSSEIISISQEDSRLSWCQCPKCRALDEMEGTHAGPLIHFVNAVAEDIEKEFPNVLVETLAYRYTRNPPLHVKPRHNVVISLCAYECDYAHPLDSDANADFRNDFDEWSKMASRILIWNYDDNYQHMLLPHPDINVFGPNARCFAKRNTFGVFDLGDGTNQAGEFAQLRTWALAHLQWNPNRDAGKLVAEFVKGYYGPAAPYISEYIALAHNALRRSGIFMDCCNPDFSFMGIREMNKATELFDQAEKAVADNPQLLLRVRRDRVPLDHLWLFNYQRFKREAALLNEPYLGPKDPKAACDEFLRKAGELGTYLVTEDIRTSDYGPSLKVRCIRPDVATMPEECKNPSKGDWIDIQDDDFSLYNDPIQVSLISDPKASDGAAACMPGDYARPVIAARVPRDTSGKWHCYISVRCETKAATGIAFVAGIEDCPIGLHDRNVGMRDLVKRRRVAYRSVKIEDVRDAEYHAYDLGVHELKYPMYFWAAACANPDAVEAVYVDRVFLVREK